MVRDTAITDGNAANWTNNRVGVTPGTPPALTASNRDSSTFNRVLAGWVHFRHNGEIASEFFGWPCRKLYPARGCSTGANVPSNLRSPLRLVPALKQFIPANYLGITTILNLDPAWVVVLSRIAALAVLGYDSLQVALTGQLKHTLGLRLRCGPRKAGKRSYRG